MHVRRARRETPRMRLNLSADEVLTTTFGAQTVGLRSPGRARDRHGVPRHRAQAPTGSNSQGWQWVFVADADKKQQLRDIYRENFRMYRDMPRPSTRRTTRGPAARRP